MTLPSPFQNPFGSTLRTVYLGTPGAMVSARVPDAGVQYPLTRAGSASQLISGGTSIARRLRTRRRFVYNWSDRTIEEQELALALYTGLTGDGPFCLIDPSWRNMMGQAVSTFGKQLRVVSGWSPTASTRPVTYDTATAPADVGLGGVISSGVASWSPSVGDELFEGSISLGTSTYPLNGTFETDLSGWYAQGCTIAQTGAQFHSGSKSCQITGVGSSNPTISDTGDTPSYSNGFIRACVPGQTINLSAWFRAATTARNAFVQAIFFDVDFNVLSGPYVPAADSTSGWTQASLSTTVPANASYVRLQVGILSSVNAEVHYVDDIVATVSGVLLLPDADTITRAGTAVPYLPNQVHTISMAARAVSGTPRVTLVAYGLSAAGAVTGAAQQYAYDLVVGPTTTLSSGAWTWLTVSVPIGAFPVDTAFICASLRALTTPLSGLKLSNPMHDIGVATRRDWVPGLGVPRVVVLDDNPAGSQFWDRQTMSLVLAEI